MLYGTDLNHDWIRKIIVCRNLGGFLFICVCVCVHFKFFKVLPLHGDTLQKRCELAQSHIHWI